MVRTWHATFGLSTLLGWSLLVSTVSRADTTATGWGSGPRASPDAWDRARSWESGPRTIVDVASPLEQDDFAETLARLSFAEPLDARALEDQSAAARALAHALGPILGSATLEHVEVTDLGKPTGIVLGQWRAGGLAYRGALAATGTSQTLLVMVVRSGEESLYVPVFEAGVRDLRPSQSVRPFDVGVWRWTSIAGWSIVTVVAWVAAARMRDDASDHRQAGRVSAVVLLCLAMVVAAVVYLASSQHAESLELVGLTREWLAVETAGIGLALGMFVWMATAGLRGKPVASAPMSGAFAKSSPRRVQTNRVAREGPGGEHRKR